MIDLISLWAGRIVLVALAIYLIWHLVFVFVFAVRDTIILLLNAIDAEAFGRYYWRVILIPLIFLRDVWEQTNARIGGYQITRCRRRIN